MRKSIIWISVLSVVCIFIIWHTIYWYTTGMHDRLIELAGEGKAYLSVLYNISLIAVLAVTLGMLMGKISEVMSHRQHTADNPDNPNKADMQ